MKLLKLHDEQAATDLSDLSDLMPFNDNGGQPDGTCYLIPLDECPQSVLDDPDHFGILVDGDELVYEPTREMENGNPAGDQVWPTFDGDWMGMQFDGLAYIVR